MMRLLATFPDLGSPAGPATVAVCPEPAAEPTARPTEPDPADSADAAGGSSGRPARTIRRTSRSRFPWASVAALIAVAMAIWSLASWNDARRLARQQAESRLAERPVTAGPEAVLR